MDDDRWTNYSDQMTIWQENGIIDILQVMILTRAVIRLVERDCIILEIVFNSNNNQVISMQIIHIHLKLMQIFKLSESLGLFAEINYQD